jgi:hypothetical protein
MGGLLGFMAAGASNGYSDGRGKELAQKQDFDLKLALLDAQMDKELRLKEAGYKMEDKRAAAEMERNKGYMADVEETTKTPESVINKYTDENGQEQVAKAGGDEIKTTRKATMQDAAERALKDGNLATYEKFKSSIPKDTFTKLAENEKLFNDRTGALIAEGNKKAEKIEVNEMIFRAAAGDKDAQAFLDKMSAIDIKKAVAGRAPTRASDDDQSYADWKSKPQNKGKGRDDYMKEKASWGKNNDLDIQTVTEKPLVSAYTGAPVLGKDGKPIIQKSISKKEKVPENDPLGIR